MRRALPDRPGSARYFVRPLSHLAREGGREGASEEGRNSFGNSFRAFTYTFGGVSRGVGGETRAWEDEDGPVRPKLLTPSRSLIAGVAAPASKSDDYAI